MATETKQPTTELKFAIKLKDFFPEDVITKETQTFFQAQVTLESAKTLRDRLTAAGDDEGLRAADLKRLKAGASILSDALKDLQERSIDSVAMDLEQHPIGQLVPKMSKAERANLRKSMEENGFLPENPIVLYQGKILDGWHRYQAATQLGIVPLFADFKGDDPVSYVLAENLHRRHLTDDQRSVIAGELAAVRKSLTTAQAAESVNVTASKATRGRRVANTSSELADAVREGTIRLTDAERICNDADLLAKLEEGESIEKLAKRAFANSEAEQAATKKPTTVRLPLEGEESWTHAEVVFDAKGEQLGEAYWRVAATPIEDMDGTALIGKVEEALGSITDRKVIKKALPDILSDREILAIYVDFEAEMPGPDMTRNKRNGVVATHLAGWFETTEAVGVDNIAEMLTE